MANYDAKTEEDRCIFCEIIKGDLPAFSFWEDEEFLAFLSIDPNTEGVSVVVPKEHFGSDVLKMPDYTLQKFIIASKKVAQILENYYEDVGRVGLIMEGMGIDHAHIKLVPMHGTEYLKNGEEWKQYLSKHEQWFPQYDGFISSAGGPMADKEKLKKLAEDIKNSNLN